MQWSWCEQDQDQGHPPKAYDKRRSNEIPFSSANSI